MIDCFLGVNSSKGEVIYLPEYECYFFQKQGIGEIIALMRCYAAYIGR